MTATTAPAPRRSTSPEAVQTSGRAQRLLPLTGVVAVALVLAGHLVHGSVPAARDNIEKVTAFYRANDSRIYVGSVLLTVATFFFVVFAATLRTRLRAASERADGAATFGFAGATIFAVGLTLTAGIGVALGHHPARLEPSAIQALHALFFDLFAPLEVGGAMFLIGNGIAIGGCRALPNWLGWSALPVGALALAPEPVGDIGFVGLGLWVVTAAAILAATRRSA
jgi:hypothetical protein